MASAQVFVKSVANNSPSQESSYPDDHFQSRYVTPGFKSFSDCYIWQDLHQTKIAKTAVHSNISSIYAFALASLKSKEDYKQEAVQKLNEIRDRNYSRETIVLGPYTLRKKIASALHAIIAGSKIESLDTLIQESRFTLLPGL